MTYIAKQDEYKDVYCFNAEFEYTATLKNELIQIGTGLPANSTLIEVIPHKDGFARVFNEDTQKWEYVEDHRYKTAYDINTKQEFEIDYFGELNEEHTLLAPPSFDHDFIDGAWVITEEKKAELEAQAEQQNILELEAQIKQLKQELLIAGMRGKDTTEIIAELDTLEAELENLK